MNRRIASCLIALASLLGACNPTYYKPNALNVPMLTSKEKGSISASSDFNRTFNFNGSVAATENIGVAAGYSFVSESNHNGNLLEFGVGYSGLLSEKLHGEVFAGYGFGTFQTYTDSSGTKLFTRGNIGRAYLQPSLGYRLSENFEAAVALRLAYLSYGDLTFDRITAVGEFDPNNPTYLLAEPGLLLRGGINNIMVELQFVHTGVLSSKPLSIDASSLYAGLRYRF